MSAEAMKAWNNVTRQRIEDALSRLHPDDRPSYEAVVAVGRELSVFVNKTKGYCDSTISQLYDAMKGAYGESVIRNACWALQVAGVVANVRGGTKGKDGKGRGAWRVFVDADSCSLIPADYSPPQPRRDPDTGHDLSESRNDSDTGSGDRDTGWLDSDTGHDLSTPKEPISSSTAALAGRSTTEDSLGRVDTNDSEGPTRCETCSTVAADAKRVERLAVAAISNDDLTRGMSHAARKRLRAEATPYAQLLVQHFPEKTQRELTTAIVEIMRDRQHLRGIGPGRHDYALAVASSVFDAT